LFQPPVAEQMMQALEPELLNLGQGQRPTTRQPAIDRAALIGVALLFAGHQPSQDRNVVVKALLVSY